ncbi:hypothetical protein PTTG_07522 [Puccinia triticina 1-1 BBBD Race 1]|uniref:Uncharacterized protein n=1 Tax=Puccinia triticina (isolate 1-1 / race 1 (BBBD)) TaxID=630390 RepID=A0A0C4F348_PUCT1|nr:hypothetical protein PTTG_07522 [Puccinia triticina 1-1 BBBD Race 1]
MVLSTNDNPQLGKSREDYSRLASLLENTKDQILGYFPSGIHPATLGDQQLEYEVYNELTTLFTLARDFSGSFRKAHQDDIRSAVQSHPIDLAVSTDREEYDSWADELDARGVELWNRASQLRRILDSQRSSKPDYIELNKIYHSALRLLHQKNSSQSPLITSKNKKHQEPLLSEKICAKMRQLGFTMIYAGSPVKKDTALLLKLVSLSSKSSKAQLMVYDLESAMKNIETAWELEQQLQEIQSNPDNSTITKDKDFICTMLTFYSIKADCASNKFRLSLQSNNPARLISFVNTELGIRK